jgi:hypothetical protein
MKRLNMDPEDTKGIQERFGVWVGQDREDTDNLESFVTKWSTQTEISIVYDKDDNDDNNDHGKEEEEEEGMGNSVLM